MIALSAKTYIWIAAGVTDMRRGFTGLSALVQTKLEQRPFSGHVFVFRGRRGDLIKVLWWDGDGLCLFAKRLERGRFIWPQATEGTVSLTRAQLSMLLEGIDWRHRCARRSRGWRFKFPGAICIVFCGLHGVSRATLMAYSVCGYSPHHPSRPGCAGSR
jgi:transposase